MTVVKKLLIGIAALAVVGCALSSVPRSQTSKDRKASGPYERAAEYSKSARGLSVLIIKNEKMVFEEYQNGHNADTAHMLASGTKSFSGVLLAAAIEDKLVSGFDEKVSDTITEWKTDKRLSAITLRQLLSLTSGIDAGNSGRPPAYADAIKYKSRFETGTTFQYGPVPFQVFGEVLKRKLASRKETVLDYLKRRILNPIGLEIADWNIRDGQPDLPSGAELTAREWSKFGVFLLNQGKWNGKQIVDAKLIRELSKGTNVNPNYGLTFWLNKDHTGKANLAPPPTKKSARLRELLKITPVTDEVSENGLGKSISDDVYVAAGFGNQRLYIIPSKKMIVVRQGKLAKFDDEEFLSLLLDIKK